MLEGKKILILHDRFMFRGGGERLVLDMARGLGADIATEFWMPESFPRSDVPRSVFVLDEGIPKPIVWRYFRSHLNFLLKTKPFIRNYDVVIFSGNNCLTASLNLSRNTPKIVYVHHPVRYVYDLLSYRRAQETSSLKRFVYYDVGKWLIRFIYRFGLSRMDTVIANSENVKQRLKVFCKTETQVVYPPIQIDKFQWRGQGDYYLAFGRIDDLKRTLDIIKAFQQTPEKKLIVAGGGPLLEDAKKLAEPFSNIQVLGNVPDQQLFELVGNCIASIYIPKDEDFGMIPVESMSSGKPCISVNEGGMKESVIDGKTGFMIPSNYTIDDIVCAVNRMTPEKALSMKTACIETAQQFSYDVFVESMKEVVRKSLRYQQIDRHPKLDLASLAKP